VLNSGDVVAIFEAKRTRSSALKLVAFMMLFLVFAIAVMLPMALLDLVGERPAVRLDDRGGDVRAAVRRRRFRWDDVVAIQGGSKGFRIRLARGGSIRVAGEFEGHLKQDSGATALALWTSATRH
jgi:hypothetical protein